MTSSPKNMIKSLLRLMNLDVRIASKDERRKFAWLNSHDIRTVLDVGGNRGQFAMAAHKHIPGAYIYSFEPLTDVYMVLAKTCQRVARATAINVALGDTNGVVQINRNGFSQSSSMLDMACLHTEAYPFAKDISKEGIVVKRLDDFIDETGIDLVDNILLKLDVQGYEDRVIAGAVKTISRIKVIIAEVSYCELFAGQMLFGEFKNLLEEKGFFYKGNLADYFHPQTGMPLFADAIFIRDND